jgi:hypothetical protein
MTQGTCYLSNNRTTDAIVDGSRAQPYQIKFQSVNGWAGLRTCEIVYAERTRSTKRTGQLDLTDSVHTL